MAVIVPTLRHERRLWNEGLTRVVGVDEVGVAPTCGAVVAAAVIMKPGCHRIPGVRDSKTLSMLQRERLAPLIRKRAVAIGVGAASVREIDQLNIYHATHLAMRRAIARVGGHEHVIVDGNRIVGFEAQVGPYSNVVDGDAKVYVSNGAFSEGHLWCYEADLTPVWDVAFPAVNQGGPSIASDGTLIVAGTGTNIRAYKAPRPQCLAGDLDCDGTIGPADLALLLGAWGRCRGACDADLDGDGIVGPSDLAILLGAWG